MMSRGGFVTEAIDRLLNFASPVEFHYNA